MANAVLYARLSKDRLGSGEGVARQLEDARKLAELRGYTIIGERVDNDTSAAGAKHRPGFEQLLDDVQTGRATVVISWTLDRLTRNRKDTVRLIEVCQAAEATVALVRGSDMDLSTPAGRLAADILAAVSRNEIEAKADRQRRASEQRAQDGKPPSRRAFGYNLDGTKQPDEAPVVVDLFTQYLAGASIAGLAKGLNARGITTTRGRGWDDTTVRQLLANPRYAGERWYRHERIGMGDWEPLVSAATFEAVAAKLKARGPRAPGRRWLGSALYRCFCGSLVVVTYNAQKTRVYVCSTTKHMARRADPVDDYVKQIIVARLRRDDVANLLAPTRPDIDVSALRREAIAVNTQMDQLGVERAKGLLTAGQVRAATIELEAILKSVEAQLAEAGQESALGDLLSAPDPGAAWLAQPLDRQRAALDALCTVTILRGRKGRLPFDPSTVDIAFRA